MKFDNGEAHAYNLASQRKLRPILEDAHTLTATALFNMVDTDSSGTIELPEFKYMHTMVLKSGARAAAEVADAKRGEDEQRRYKRAAARALAAAILVILALLGGMVGISLRGERGDEGEPRARGRRDGGARRRGVARRRAPSRCRSTWRPSCPSASASRSR